jgi:toxin ParE1/3/4
LEAAAGFIARDSPRFAAALMDSARFAARSLRRFPERGWAVPEIGDPAVRELFVKHYRLIYEVGEQQIVILAFLHGARQFPETLR